jgi:hypothetical protein
MSFSVLPFFFLIAMPPDVALFRDPLGRPRPRGQDAVVGKPPDVGIVAGSSCGYGVVNPTLNSLETGLLTVDSKLPL